MISLNWALQVSVLLLKLPMDNLQVVATGRIPSQPLISPNHDDNSPIRYLLHQSRTCTPSSCQLEPRVVGDVVEDIPRVIIRSFSDFGFHFTQVEYHTLGLIVIRLDIVHGNVRSLLREV